MNDLISRQAAISAVEKESQVDGAYGYMDTKSIVDLLNDLPSAQRWIPFTMRELTAEEQEEHPEWSYIMDCPLPDDGQEILVSNGRLVWKDEFYLDDCCYLDSDHELEGCAWMPLPEPWKGE